MNLSQIVFQHHVLNVTMLNWNILVIFAVLLHMQIFDDIWWVWVFFMTKTQYCMSWTKAGKSKSGFGFKSGFDHFSKSKWIWLENVQIRGFGFGFEFGTASIFKSGFVNLNPRIWIWIWIWTFSEGWIWICIWRFDRIWIWTLLDLPAFESTYTSLYQMIKTFWNDISLCLSATEYFLFVGMSYIFVLN